MLAVFAVKTPRPLKNRDFVTQRVWQELDREMMIFNHSVNHTVHAELLQTVYHCRLLVSLDCLSLYAACILRTTFTCQWTVYELCQARRFPFFVFLSVNLLFDSIMYWMITDE